MRRPQACEEVAREAVGARQPLLRVEGTTRRPCLVHRALPLLEALLLLLLLLLHHPKLPRRGSQPDDERPAAP